MVSGAASQSSSVVANAASRAIRNGLRSASILSNNSPAQGTRTKRESQARLYTTLAFRGSTGCYSADASDIRRSFSSNGKRDFYEVLGVPKGADKGTIKKAYFKLAKEYHPDTNKVRRQASITPELN